MGWLSQGSQVLLWVCTCVYMYKSQSFAHILNAWPPNKCMVLFLCAIQDEFTHTRTDRHQYRGNDANTYEQCTRVYGWIGYSRCKIVCAYVCVRVCLCVFHTIALLRFAHTHTHTRAHRFELDSFCRFCSTSFSFTLYFGFRYLSALSLSCSCSFSCSCECLMLMYALSECVILNVLWCYCLVVWLIHNTYTHMDMDMYIVHMKAETWQWMVNLVAHCTISAHTCKCVWANVHIYNVLSRFWCGWKRVSAVNERTKPQNDFINGKSVLQLIIYRSLLRHGKNNQRWKQSTPNST